MWHFKKTKVEVRRSGNALPCPICGNAVIPSQGYLSGCWCVRCHECNVSGPYHNTLSDAIKEWNKSVKVD